MGDTEIEFIPAHSTEVEDVLRATMSDRDDESVKDDAADEAERSMFDNFAADTKATLRDDAQTNRSFDREFNRHSAAMRLLNQPPAIGGHLWL
jgi:hypothetical protein